MPDKQTTKSDVPVPPPPDSHFTPPLHAVTESFIDSDQLEDFFDDVTRISFTVIILGFDFIALLGNALIVVAYVRVAALRRPAHNVYFVCQAVTDLIVSLFCIPFYTMTILLGRWPFGYEFCIIWSSLDVATRLEEVLLSTLITYDRYLSVSKPLDVVLHSCKIRAARHVTISCFGAVLLTVPFTAIGHHWIVQKEHEVSCSPLAYYDSPFHIGELMYDVTYSSLSLLWDFLIPLILIVTWNWTLYREIDKRANKISTIPEGFVNAMGSHGSLHELHPPPSAAPPALYPQPLLQQQADNIPQHDNVPQNPVRRYDTAAACFICLKRHDDSISQHNDIVAANHASGAIAAATSAATSADPPATDPTAPTAVTAAIALIATAAAANVATATALVNRKPGSQKAKDDVINVLDGEHDINSHMTVVHEDHYCGQSKRSSTDGLRTEIESILHSESTSQDELVETGNVQRLTTNEKAVETERTEICHEKTSPITVRWGKHENITYRNIINGNTTNENIRFGNNTREKTTNENITSENVTIENFIRENITSGNITGEAGDLMNDGILIHGAASCMPPVTAALLIEPVRPSASQKTVLFGDVCPVEGRTHLLSYSVPGPVDNNDNSLACKIVKSKDSVKGVQIDVVRCREEEGCSVREAVRRRSQGDGENFGREREEDHSDCSHVGEGGWGVVEIKRLPKIEQEHQRRTLAVIADVAGSQGVPAYRSHDAPPARSHGASGKGSHGIPAEGYNVATAQVFHTVPVVGHHSILPLGTVHPHGVVTKRFRKATAVLIIIAAELVFLRTPYAVTRLLAAAGLRAEIGNPLYQATFWLGWGLSLVHPFLFAFISPPFRAFCRRCWERFWHAIADCFHAC